jgi:dTDP-glucose 4,6-dehydratase
LPVITVRPSNKYGQWQYPEKLIPLTIVKALKDEPVPVYGQGLNIREWLYVSDCAEAVIEIMERGSVSKIYNVASGVEKRNIDVVKSILDLVGKPHSLIEFVKDRPGHDFRYSMDTTKIERELGWKAKTDFEEGLRKTVQWYIENIDWVERKMQHLKEYWERVYKS